MIIFAGGYRVNLFFELPSAIYISPDLQLMKALVVANQGLPRMSGYPSRLFLEVNIIKSTRYSQESKDTEIYSNTPSGLITDLSINCSNVGV